MRCRSRAEVLRFSATDRRWAPGRGCAQVPTAAAESQGLRRVVQRRSVVAPAESVRDRRLRLEQTWRGRAAVGALAELCGRSGRHAAAARADVESALVEDYTFAAGTNAAAGMLGFE